MKPLPILDLPAGRSECIADRYAHILVSVQFVRLPIDRDHSTRYRQVDARVEDRLGMSVPSRHHDMVGGHPIVCHRLQLSGALPNELSQRSVGRETAERDLKWSLHGLLLRNICAARILTPKGALA